MKRDQRFREIEEMLYEYPQLSTKIDCINIELELLEAEDGLRAVRYDELLSGSGGIGDSVGALATRRIVEMEKLIKNRERLELRKKYIEKFLDLFPTQKSEILRKVYFERRSWENISKEVGYSQRQAMNIRDGLLEEYVNMVKSN